MKNASWSCKLRDTNQENENIYNGCVKNAVVELSDANVENENISNSIQNSI